MEKGKEIAIKGLYAVGEASCISVHGANRLGGNSLMEVVLFGKEAGIHAGKANKGIENKIEFETTNIGEESIEKILKLINRDGTEKINIIRDKMQRNMNLLAGILRNKKGLEDGIKNIQDCYQAFNKIQITNRSLI